MIASHPSIPRLALVTAAAIVLLFPGPAHSRQIPPATDAEGTPFLPVNINPTSVPPAVNISPNGRIPEIDIRRMPRVDIGRIPQVSVEAAGCDATENYFTDVGTAVAGPFLLTYLGLGEGIGVTFSNGGGGGVPVDLDENSPLSTALYLGRGQVLRFSESVLYSGCSPD